MRASLFLSALFVATLAGGTALAEKPEKLTKEPRLTNLRSRGDLVDGSGRHVDRARTERNVVQKVSKAEAATMLKNRGAAERVRCSEAQDDCGRGSAHASKGKGESAKAGTVGKVEMQSMLKTRQAAERVRCSEAQDDCGRGGTASSAKADSAKDQAAKSDKKVATKDTASASQAAKAAMLMKLMSAKCGARARGGCSGHDEPW